MKITYHDKTVHAHAESLEDIQILIGLQGYHPKGKPVSLSQGKRTRPDLLPSLIEMGVDVKKRNRRKMKGKPEQCSYPGCAFISKNRMSLARHMSMAHTNARKDGSDKAYEPLDIRKLSIRS